MSTSCELLVSVDIGSREHSVAIGLRDGTVVDEFSIRHERAGFDQFFEHIEKHRSTSQMQVLVAMEGYNGHARPLDRLVQTRDYRLFNVNNLKLARFKEIFPGAAKTDAIDARKGLELFQLQSSLPLAKDVLNEVAISPTENEHLKRLSRRRRRLVKERVRVVNSMCSDLQAISPGLVELTNHGYEKWFINFLLLAKTDITELARKRQKTLLRVSRIGQIRAKALATWQSAALFSDDSALVSPLVLEDARHIQELNSRIEQLAHQIEQLNGQSDYAQLLQSIPGFGTISAAELAGEIGSMDRFAGSASLALYLGISPLDHSSGTSRGSRSSNQVNKRAKSAMMAAADHNRRQSEQSKIYYDKKRSEGKSHNQALRCLSLQLTKMIYKMLTSKLPYKNKSA